MDITKTELEVMQVIWSEHPCSAAKIIEKLNEQVCGQVEQSKSWHEKTVKTLLNRLVKKEAVSFNKDSRRYLYFPLIEMGEYQKAESTNLLDKLFGGKLSPMVASFASHKKLQKDDVEQLKKLIADWEEDND